MRLLCTDCYRFTIDICACAILVEIPSNYSILTRAVVRWRNKPLTFVRIFKDVLAKLFKCQLQTVKHCGEAIR